jgi:E3 ubiquitin-protein ligase MARCH6
MATNNAGERGPDYIEQPDPDLMNDPQYATNTETSEDGTGEADTCRICRGEASEQEPLFYPCKCSGSIKFVHQDCLMEWLSHSQKKHCELCKTPFRFTKLYSPNMPQNLPTHVFLRHLAIHAVKNLAIWLRFCLVVFVWLGCLPWAMRHVWGFLFWFGDGGWTSKDVGPRLPYNDTARTLEMITKAREHLDILIGNGTSPATPLLSSPTTAATVGAVLNRLPALLSPMVRFFNLSAVGEPFPFGSLKDLYHGVGFRSSGPLVNNTNTMHVIGQYRLDTPGHTSLLSEVRFLKGLTRHPGFNRVIITTLEGQIITIVVVVCFVLVFLIREWVVQQQPGINMGAGFNAEFAAGERPPRNRNVLPDNAPDAEGFPADMGRNVDEFLHDVEQRQAVDVAARPIARPRRRMVRFEDGGGNDTMPAQEDRENAVPPVPSNNVKERADAGEGPVGSSNQQRPRILARDALSPAAEIQRQLAEDSSSMHERFDVAEFVSLWRRAGGNPEEVLKLLEEDGLGEKLRYWKNAMRQLQARSGPPAQDGSKSAGDPVSPDGATPKLDALYGDGHDSNSENWVDIPSPNDERLRDMHLTTLQENQSNNSSSSSNKGKEKVVDTLAEPLGEVSNRSTPGLVSTTTRQSLASEETTWNHTSNSREAVAFSSGPGRPRAVSDGPQPRANTSPLAQSYWSFSNLPETSSHNTPISFSYTYMSGEPNTEAMPDNRRGIRHDQNSSSDVSSASVSDTLFQGASENIEVFSPGSGTTQRANSWDEVFANNPVPGSEDDFEENPVDEGNEEQNPFHPDGLLPQDVPLLENREAAPVHHNEPQGILGNIANFLWGGVNVDRDGPVGDDEHIVQDIAAEAPFVPVAHLQGPNIFDDDEGADEVVVNQDGDVVAAALAAGIDPNDPDGLDDVEDFEGIMELVGMRGPLTALIQNGLFSAVLISLTVACGVWVPYNLGRLVLLLIANPVAAIKLPLRFLFSFAAVLQDLALVAVGALSYLLIQICSLPRYLFSFTATGPTFSSIANQSSLGLGSLRFARTAGQRIIEGIVNAALQIPDSEVPAFSAVSHESLLHIKAIITNTIQYIGSTITSRLASRTIESASVTSIDFTAVWAVASRHGIKALQLLQRLPAVLTTTESWVISLDMPPRVVPVDPSLSYWSGLDRFWAILTGYIAFSFLGAAYLKKGSPFSTSQVGREWEATIIDVLNQAGGVMKVILIIGIEMLVFPLYCGLLLDLALLPLFDNATILSRVLFTIGSPLTSIFVHWFVGTCYMFHFALFVSMCRKIMRTGVLCE